MNRLQGVKESNGVLTEYEFDSFGNISREYTLTANGIKTTQYEYDGNNCLLISFDDRSSTRYTYDKSGNLINKIYELSGRETKSYYYDGADIVSELTNDNYYIYYRGTELISSKSYENHSHYYRLDSHGSVTDLVNHLGESKKSYAYTPYGEERLFGLNPAGEQTILYHWQKETDGTHNPFRYCGEYYDEESGLIYLRNRYYDPTTGRFITEDPARDGLNWYVYCGCNPIMFVDPTGLEALLDKYINENYAGQANVAILVNRPVANSRDAGAIVDGKLVNGHAFIRLDNGNGNVEYIGFAANPSAELGMKEMLLNTSVDSIFRDDSKYDWNVGKVYSLSDRQYELVSDYISYVKERKPKYNIVRRNCVDFAISIIESAGIQANTTNIKRHRWTVPDNFKEQIVNFDAYPQGLPVGVADALVKVRFGSFYGYTPADAAQDMKKSSGTTLLKYNDVMEVLTNN